MPMLWTRLKLRDFDFASENLQPNSQTFLQAFGSNLAIDICRMIRAGVSYAMAEKLSFLVLLLGLLLPTTMLAQDAPASTDTASDVEFALFESLDGATNNNASDVPGASNANSAVSRATQATPAFVLVGTTRIGDAQSALLRHLSGEVIRVPLTGTSNPIPGHELYTVVDRQSGQVSVRYPAAIPCGDFPDQGVDCDANTNIATLSLTTARAVITETAAEETQAPEAETIRNPFEAIRERGRIGDPNQPARFQPRRIPPEDVPPGYRVVSTPFGDRLVEQ